MTGVLLLVKIGWRNLWRNPRGTLLTALASGLGLTLLLISLGLLDGSHEQMVDNAVRFGTGHVVIQAQGYQDTGSLELLLPARVASMTGELMDGEAMKHVLGGMSPRLLASGLLSSAANASGVSIMGVIPGQERAVSLIPQRIVEGNYLKGDEQSGVVIGAELARKLAVKAGGKVVLMTQAVQLAHDDAGGRGSKAGTEAAGGDGGEMQSTLVGVSGIFRTGIEAIDAHVIQLPLGEAQALLGVPGRVTEVAVLLAQEGDSEMVARSLRTRLTGLPVEVLTWRESMPALAQSYALDEAFNYVMNGVVLAMVGLGILNTILMRVLERRFEFGLCSALGLRPAQLAVMVVGESLALTAISLALGLVLGLSAQHYFATAGFDLRWFFKGSLATALVFDPIIYSRLSVARMAWSVAIVFVTATVISFYPALKAARTDLPGALKVF
jgi:ABC-type lipoprotein release transport system permease subunit